MGHDLGPVPVFSDLVSLQYVRPEGTGQILFGNSDLATLDPADPDRLRPGGYLMMSNYLDDDEPRAVEIEQAMGRLDIGLFRFRTWTEQQRLLEGLELVIHTEVRAGPLLSATWTAEAAARAGPLYVPAGPNG